MGRATSAQALKRAADEPEAFTCFYRQHVGPLFAYIARRVYDPEVAMDLTSESFAQAFLARRRFRGTTDEQAAAWLYRIASRQLARYFRKSKVERRALARLGIEPPQLDDDQLARLEEISETAGIRAALRTELEQLSGAQREALKLRIVDELPYATVAGRLGITERAARNRVMRGLKALASGLNRSPQLEESQL